jgi:pilus assembly protein CpaC
MRGHEYRWLAAIICVMGLCGMVSAQTGAASEAITLTVGRSTIVTAPWPTVRVAVTDPAVAGVQVLTPQQVLVQGLKVGSTDLILWSEDQSQTLQRRVVVRLDLESIQAALQRLFPGAELTASDSGDVLLVQGLVRSADQAVQLKEYLERTKIPYVNMTSLAGIQQVQLQVRLAEVSKRASRALGINWFIAGHDAFIGQRTGSIEQSISMGAEGGQDVTGNLDFTNEAIGPTGPLVNLFAGFPGQNVALFFHALEENQYMRILANPTLVALSGEEAQFLAGGEFPIPVPQLSGGGGQTITVEYKQFGVLLAFQPVVLGDGTIRLRASQEVSELSAAGGFMVAGVSVPALSTRRAETTLELNSGQSFAMAGLLRSTDSAGFARLPGLGNLPIIGPLFRSVQYEKQETELVILVTASLVEPITAASAPPLPGVTYAEPNDWEFYAEGRLEGKKPAKIDPATQKWLKDMGLDQLVGPGAWDSYEEQTYPELARTAEAQAQPAAATTEPKSTLPAAKEPGL